MSHVWLDSIRLREIADWAASLRGAHGDRRFFVAAQPEPGEVSIHPEPEPVPHPDGVPMDQIPASTNTVQPERPRVTGVGIRAEGMAEGDWESLSRYDAVFWSEAAVEKFLFPYYASKYQWAAAHVLQVMSQVFYGYVPRFDAGLEASDYVADSEAPVAMAHLPRSEYTDIEDPAEEPPPGDQSGGDQPEGAEFTLGRDLVVILVDRITGKLIHRPFSEYLRRARKEAEALGAGGHAPRRR